MLMNATRVAGEVALELQGGPIKVNGLEEALNLIAKMREVDCDSETWDDSIGYGGWCTWLHKSGAGVRVSMAMDEDYGTYWRADVFER